MTVPGMLFMEYYSCGCQFIDATEVKTIQYEQSPGGERKKIVCIVNELKIETGLALKLQLFHLNILM